MISQSVPWVGVAGVEELGEPWDGLWDWVPAPSSPVQRQGQLQPWGAGVHGRHTVGAQPGVCSVHVQRVSSGWGCRVTTQHSEQQQGLWSWAA